MCQVLTSGLLLQPKHFAHFGDSSYLFFERLRHHHALGQEFEIWHEVALTSRMGLLPSSWNNLAKFAQCQTEKISHLGMFNKDMLGLRSTVLSWGATRCLTSTIPVAATAREKSLEFRAAVHMRSSCTRTL